MPACGSGVVVCSSSLLLCSHPGRGQAETPPIQPVQKPRASSGIADFKLTTVDVKPLGTDAAREIGTFTLRTKGQPPQEVTGKYVVVWQKVGGDWKLATDIWNSDK